MDATEYNTTATNSVKANTPAVAPVAAKVAIPPALTAAAPVAAKRVAKPRVSAVKATAAAPVKTAPRKCLLR